MSISTVERSSTERAIELCEDSFNSLFDDSPVMMAGTQGRGKVVRLGRVNDQFIGAMGYGRETMLGHDPREFLTEESQLRDICHIRPLLHDVNTARSIGLTFLTKDHRNLDVIADLERIPVSEQNSVSFGTLYNPNDVTQWQQASTTMRALIEFKTMQHKLDVITTGEDWDAPQPDHPSAPRSGLLVQVDVAEKALGVLAEACNDISLNLRGMAGLQEQCIDSLMEHTQELVSVVKTMDKSLEGLGNIIEQLADPSNSELLQTISSIGNGEVSLHPRITRELVHRLSQTSDLATTVDPITEREADVLKLVAGGFSNKEIAQKLIVTERTVDKHVSSILSKLDVTNRTQAALCALRTGLATLDPE